MSNTPTPPEAPSDISRPRATRTPRKKTTSPSDTPAAAAEETALVLTPQDHARLLAYDPDTILAGITLAMSAARRGLSKLEHIKGASRAALLFDHGLKTQLPCNTPLWTWEGDTLCFHCLRRIPAR